MRVFAAIALLMLAAVASAEDAPTPNYDQALKDAAQRSQPLIIDFQAPWCYSCYYMSRHVLVGAEWQRIEHSSVVLELDADSPEGERVKAQWGIKALPSYLVLDPQGRELGRILGEQKPEDFYGRLRGMFQRNVSFDELRAKATAGDQAAARELLRLFHARYDAVGGLAWYAALPAAQRKTFEADTVIRSWRARLELLKASKAQDAAACDAIAPQVLAGDLGCERAYELDRWMSCGAPADASARKQLLKAQQPAMQKLVSERVFGKGPLCADQRSAILTLADLYEATGVKPQSEQLLRRAADQLAKQTRGKLADDRNRADNLRVYLEALQDNKALDALYPQLISAYPNDYVYPYRYGKNLLARGKAAESLPWLEKAAERAYGANRLQVTEQRILALKQLNRADEARRVLSETLQANGPWFPEQTTKLKALLTG